MDKQKQPATSTRFEPTVMPLYAVQRCRKDGKVYGLVHGSEDCNGTTCGLPIDHNWWILSNDSSRKPTCKACGPLEA